MHLPENAERLRIYLGENDHVERRPLYEAIVARAREMGMAGATAFRGITGFGGRSRIRTSKILLLSEDLPIVVEIVDTPERIDAFLHWLDSVPAEGLVTREPVTVPVRPAGDRPKQTLPGS